MVAAPGGSPAETLDARPGDLAGILRWGYPRERDARTSLMDAGHLALASRSVRPRRSADGRSVALDHRGEVVRDRDRRTRERLAEEWSLRVGADSLDAFDRALRDVLESPGLPATLDPAPVDWRAQGRYRRLTELFVADPAGHLPRFPVMLHRGGYPDGS